MSVCDIIQMMGRSGRPRYDKLGNAYIQIPDGDFDYHKTRIQRGQNIISNLNEPETLFFHVVSEVNNKVIKDVKTFKEWYQRSLAYLQNRNLSDDEYLAIMEYLVSKKMIYDRGQGVYAIAPLGRVCAYMYFSPKDVYEWYQNFNWLFRAEKEADDYLAIWCLVNIPSYDLYISKAEEFEADLFDKEISIRGKFCNAGSAKYGSALYATLQGVKRKALRSLQFMMKKDMERVLEAIRMIDNQYGRWHKKEFFDELALRIKYEIPKEYVQLVKVGGIGRVYAERLYQQGLKTVHDVTTHKETVLKVMGPARGEVAYASALKLKEGVKDV
jgi:helicase